MTQLTFLGATVRQAAVQASFNLGVPSQLTVSLVEDPNNGDSFAPGNVHRPVYFSWGALTFNGLLQRHVKTGDSNGFPTYEVTVVDPREVLDGTQVILGGYSGSVGLTPNVLNPYGWWENQGFGLSGSDETGMPWSKVLAALNAICLSPTLTDYGGPLNFRSNLFGLDLSQMPSVPAAYKVGSSLSVSLLELLATVCEDAGYDFFVDLVGTNIRVRTISRRSAPPLGTIEALANARRDIDLIRYSTGVEGRNEPTSAFLFGGEVRSLHRTSTLSSFWGFSESGSPILGTSSRVDLTDERFRVTLEGGVETTDTILVLQDFSTAAGSNCTWNELAAPFEIWTQDEVIGVDELLDAAGDLQGRGRTVFRVTRGKYGTTPVAYAQNRLCFLNWGSALCDRMTLNSAPVQDILGTTSYACTTFEMRLAKAGHNAWSTYIQHYRPGIAQLTGLLPPLVNKKGPQKALPQGLVNDQQGAARGMALAAVEADAQARTYRLYEFVRGFADEYMGRKFAVSLPQIQFRQDPETLRVRTSYEIDDGGYLPEGSTPLGLAALNEDVFRTQDGRLRAFAAYTSVLGADFSLVSPDSTVLQDNAFYTAIDVDPNIIYTPSPAAVVTVPGPLFDQATDSTGDVTILAATMQLPTSQAQLILKAGAWGNVGVRIAPAHRTPASVAVPLKSNTETYGPWYRSGAPGKARVDYDQSLVPWNYGGYELMDAAGFARVSEVAAALATEAGFLELAGAPTVSLGDELQENGAVVADIQVQYGTQGLTTQYRFQTYTPRFGVFARGNQERIKRLAITTSSLRRAVRGVVRGKALAAAQAGAAARVKKEFQADAPKGVKRQSPHDVLLAQTFVDGLASDRTRTGVSSLTFEEAVPSVNADDDDAYKRTAAVSWNGVLRPFSTRASAAMASFTAPSPGFSGGLSQEVLNPWRAANDIEIYLSGDSYPDGIHAYRWGSDTTNVRAVGLRGPLIVTGFGLDTEGAPTPGDGSGAFSEDFLHHPEDWPAGPVDLLWDRRRGVWTVHDVLKGVTEATLPAQMAGSGSVLVYRNGSATDWRVSAFNWGGAALPSGTSCQLLFNVLDNKWYAQDASSLTSSSGVPNLPGDPYSVLYRNASNNQEWRRDPQISGVYLGGVGLGSLGFVQFWTPLGSGFRVQASPGTDRQWGLSLPDNAPASGHVLGVVSVASDQIQTAWVPDGGFPSGAPYSVLWTSPANAREFTRNPRVQSLTVGGSGVSALASGELKLGHPSNDNFLGLSLRAAPTGDLSWRLPAGTGEVGAALTVTSVLTQSGVPTAMLLDWILPQGSGLSTTFEYVSNVECSGSTLVVTKRAMHFYRGGLVNEF